MDRFHLLWGPERDLDFWAAVQSGLVPDPEQRAVQLLASITDSRRLRRYLLTGVFRAMGNVTKRIYEIERHGNIHELEDGRRVVSHCLHAPNWHILPATDHIVAIKNLIEGEELVFKKKAISHPVGEGPLPIPYPHPQPYHIPDPRDDDYVDVGVALRERIQEEIQRELQPASQGVYLRA